MTTPTPSELEQLVSRLDAGEQPDIPDDWWPSLVDYLDGVDRVRLRVYDELVSRA